jgi:pyrophosphatase PpaX
MVKGILFDLDGTLIDTNELIISSYRYTLKSQLRLEVSREEIIGYFGEPLMITLGRYCSAEQLPQLVKCYREYNLARHDTLTKSFPGVREALQLLKSRGLLIAVVTSKMRDTAQKGLALLNLLEHIDVLVGFEDTAKHKPDPGPVQKALEYLALDPSQVLMVGDSPYDVRSAHGAGVRCGVVEYSIFERGQLEKEKPDFWLTTLLDLPKYIGGIDETIVY